MSLWKPSEEYLRAVERYDAQRAEEAEIERKRKTEAELKRIEEEKTDSESDEEGPSTAPSSPRKRARFNRVRQFGPVWTEAMGPQPTKRTEKNEHCIEISFPGLLTEDQCKKLEAFMRDMLDHDDFLIWIRH